jgi:hypothetical protein
MRGVLKLSLFVGLSLAAIGCGGGDDVRAPATVPTVYDDDGGADLCIDRDHDGYGRNCDQGKDCDDDDPNVTDECRRCLSIAQDCPCTRGTSPIRCVPPTIRVDGGVLVCTEGTRYCRDGYWSGCEVIGDYVFRPN